MKIVLLGKSGQVGRELERALRPLGTVVACDRSQADLEQPDGVRAVLRREAADVVVNAAAYTAVDRAESEPDRARRINAEAVAVIAAEVAARGGWLVHYSTDYVFDGTKSGGYVEADATGPLNVYGSTKLEGERAIAASGCRHLIFRTSWVYAAHGSNFVRTILRLLQERPALSVVDDQIGAPTSAARIADVTAGIVRGLGGQEREPPVGGLYHLAPSGETSWHGFATFIAAAARAGGLPLRVAPDEIAAIPSSAYPQAARRPANSRLDATRLRDTFGIDLPPWQDDVRQVLATLLSNANAT
jgi:dTDP-4-dehydrorhamnose reductase